MVVATARERWAASGELSRVFPWTGWVSQMGRPGGKDSSVAVVLLPRLQRIECVITDAEDMRLVFEELRVLVARGWKISVLVPIQILGAAHEAFSGLAIDLQGWWSHNGSEFRFSSPEKS